MKKLPFLTLAVLVALSATVFAGGPILGLRGLTIGQTSQLTPEPVEPYASGPTLLAPVPSDPLLLHPEAVMTPGVGVPVQPLFHNVKYKSPRKIERGFVPLIVEVQDPCWTPCPGECTPRCVAVQICVPPRCTPKISCSRDGQRVHYDYGRFDVVITSRNGQVVVNYN